MLPEFQEKYIFDDQNRKIEVILPYVVYEKIRPLIRPFLEKASEENIPSGNSQELIELMKKNRKKFPPMNLDQAIREDRDRF